MKKQSLSVCAIFCALFSYSIFSQQTNDVEQLDEVVVTATKFETNKKNVGKIVYQITQETIKNNMGYSLVDLLNDVTGIEINGNFSVRGQNLGYYARGGRNRQVAILIDGVNVNDPSSFNGDFDLRQIDINQVEKVEILKGAASTLYGTGAATAVINIILKKASKKEFSGSLTTSTGTNASAENNQIGFHEKTVNFNLNGTVNKIDYLLSLNATGSSNLSAAESTTNIPFVEDIFARQNLLFKLNYNSSTNVKFGIFTSIDDFFTDFDGFDFDIVTFKSIPADRNNRLHSFQKRFGFTTDYNYKNGALKVRTFITNIKRTETPSDDFFVGEALGFDVFNNYNISQQLSILTGITAQHQDMEQQTGYATINRGAGKQYFYDPYLSLNYNSKIGFNLNAGTRVNIHNEYGSNWVYNINPSYNFTLNNNEVKLFSSYSTAFVTPTLSEIFTKSPSINQLLPEDDTTIEAGFELRLSNKWDINTTYFYREETNKIGYDPTTFQTINDLGTFFARGLEMQITYQFTKAINFLVNYTYLNREENLLLKIPANKLFIKSNLKISPVTFASVSYRFVDDTKDFGNVELPSYNLIDVNFNHAILENKLTFFGSVTNVFNENFQEIAGFTTRGRNINLGMQLQF